VKPSWNDAPEWANYLAMDSGGSWLWFENKPLLRSGSWIKANINTDRLKFSGCVEDLEPKFEQRPE
jgi:hypothetical protein